jgi:hypothetical protein
MATNKISPIQIANPASAGKSIDLPAVQCESSAKAYMAAVNKSKNQVTW